MNINNITNNTVTSIDNCASEPIHVPGAIQPHGILLAVGSDDNTILYCSGNTKAGLGLSPEELLGRRLEVVFNELASILNQLEIVEDVPVTVDATFSGIAFALSVYLSGRLVIIELEPPAAPASADRIHDEIGSFIGQMEFAESLQQLSQQVAQQIRKSTGFDRVMVYCFDKEYNGQIFAESKIDELESLFDLHYPHSDIPPQARELYLRNPLRLIPDVNYQPVPLLTLNQGSAEDVDLSHTGIRSVSPIHIQYLKNMQVGATLTISLLLEGKLWGLIACHHRTPLFLDYRQRKIALLQANFLGSQIRVRQVAEEYKISTECEAHLQQLLGKINQEEDFSLKFQQFTSLLAISNASGVVVVHRGELYTRGTVPSVEQIRALVSWLATNVSAVQFCTSFLKDKYDEGEKIARSAAGILYYPLGKPTEEAIIWFRPEVERTIHWAGNPNEPVKKDPVKNMLTPRTSFAAWKQQVRWHSKEWRVPEINAASRFAAALQNHFHLLHLRSEEARQRVLNEKLRKANEELANINWITSHDLKEPIRKIQVFASKMLHQTEAELSATILSSINKIQESASRMRNLVDDILNYAVISSRDDMVQMVDLNTLANEISADVTGNDPSVPVFIHVDTLPTVRGLAFQLRQLFNNLVQNAIKFRKRNQAASIYISAQSVTGGQTGLAGLNPAQTYHQITVRDEGIGFDEHQKEKIFQIFYRLHDKTAYEGTGMGLAIVRKIAENHGGAIIADGTADEGATFTLYLPVY